MAYLNPCCCGQDGDVFGLIVQTIRKKRPEDVMVQAATRNFFLFQELGATGLSGDTIIGKQIATDELLQELRKGNPFQRGLSGNYYRLDDLSVDSGTIIPFSGPHYVGTYTDAFIQGVSGDTLSYVRDSTWNSRLEVPTGNQNYDIYYEYDLFLPEELRNSEIASIKGEYGYFDRYCANETGPCFGKPEEGLTGWRNGGIHWESIYGGLNVNKYGESENDARVSGGNVKRDLSWGNSGRNYVLPAWTGRGARLADVNDTLMGSDVSQRQYIPIITEFYTTISNHWGATDSLLRTTRPNEFGAVYAYRNILKKGSKTFYAKEYDEEYFFENWAAGYSFYSRDDVSFSGIPRIEFEIDPYQPGGPAAISGVRGVYTDTVFKYWNYFETNWRFNTCCPANLNCTKGNVGGSLEFNRCQETTPGCGNTVSGPPNSIFERLTPVKTNIRSVTKVNFSKGVSRISKLLSSNKPSKKTGGLTLNPANSFSIYQSIDRSWLKAMEPLVDIQTKIEFERQDWPYHYVKKCGFPCYQGNNCEEQLTKRALWTGQISGQAPYTSIKSVCVPDGQTFMELIQNPFQGGTTTWDRFYSNNIIRIYYYDWESCPKAFKFKHLYYPAIQKELQYRKVPMSIVRMSPITYYDKTTNQVKKKYFITGEYFYVDNVQQFIDHPKYRPFIDKKYVINVCNSFKFLRLQSGDCPSGTNSFDVENYFDKIKKQKTTTSCGDENYEESWNDRCYRILNGCKAEPDLQIKPTYFNASSAFGRLLSTSLTGSFADPKIEFWGGYNHQDINRKAFYEWELSDIPTTMFKRYIDKFISPYNSCDRVQNGFSGPVEVSYKLYYGFAYKDDPFAFDENKPSYTAVINFTGIPVLNPQTTTTWGFILDKDFRLFSWTDFPFQHYGWPIIQSKDYFGTTKDLNTGTIAPGPGVNVISRDNNPWYAIKNYAKDVWKCGALKQCDGFNTKDIYSKSVSQSKYPVRSFFDAYPMGFTATHNMCKRLIDFFGITQDRLNPSEFFVNLEKVFPQSPAGLTIGAIYDWKMPLYASNDADFQSVFWRYASGITKGYTFAGWTLYQL